MPPQRLLERLHIMAGEARSVQLCQGEVLTLCLCLQQQRLQATQPPSPRLTPASRGAAAGSSGVSAGAGGAASAAKADGRGGGGCRGGMAGRRCLPAAAAAATAATLGTPSCVLLLRMLHRRLPRSRGCSPLLRLLAPPPRLLPMLSVLGMLCLLRPQRRLHADHALLGQGRRLGGGQRPAVQRVVVRCGAARLVLCRRWHGAWQRTTRLCMTVPRQAGWQSTVANGPGDLPARAAALC